MKLSRTARTVLGVITGVVLAIIYIPLLIVFVNSFSTSKTFLWPPPGLTLEWWGKAFTNAGALQAIATSVLVASLATVVAL
ncbi:MAG TPA: ABC transporter permease, partial [Pseudolysinimonas sp.]